MCNCCNNQLSPYVLAPRGKQGAAGLDGASVELRIDSGFIQWRQDDDNPTWTNLVSLASITGADGTDGADGADGADGTNGTNGADGASAELRVSGGFIQWRQSDDSPTWTNLVDLDDLKGDTGDTGATGAAGTDATSPAGAVIMYAGATVPTGYLECDGASVLRSTYPDLFTAIGTTWGSVDGTHFNVPDMRGRAPIGVGSGSGLTTRALAASGGEETHVLVASEIPAHFHFVDVFQGGGTHSSPNEPNSNLTGATANTRATSTIGGNGAHNTMPPFKALKFIIKT